MLAICFKLVDDYTAPTLTTLHPRTVVDYVKEMLSPGRLPEDRINIVVNSPEVLYSSFASVGCSEMLVDRLRRLGRAVGRDIVLNITVELTLWEIWKKYSSVKSEYAVENFGHGNQSKWAPNPLLEELISQWPQGTWSAIHKLTIAAGKLEHSLLPDNLMNSRSRQYAIEQLQTFLTVPQSLFSTPHQFASAFGLGWTMRTPLTRYAHDMCSYTFQEPLTRAIWKVNVPVDPMAVGHKPTELVWGQRYSEMTYRHGDE